MEDFGFSSPDPLANSTRTAPPTEGITRRKSTRLIGAKTPLPAAVRAASRVPSEVSAAQTVQLQNIVFDTPQGHRSRSSSPTKSSIKTENHLSPWRIRVTVEAERDDESGGGDIGYSMEADPGWKGYTDSGSPSKGRTARRTRTTTTKVPVKGLESSPPAPKRRGRPKKSETPVRPRNGTPAPKTLGKRKTTGDASNGEDAEDPKLLTPKPPRARSKKGLVAAEESVGTILDMERDDCLREDTVAIASPPPVKTKTPARKTRAKKSKSPIKIAIDPDVPADVPETDSTELTGADAGHAGKVLGGASVSHVSSALVDLSVNTSATTQIAQSGNLPPTTGADFGEQLDAPTEKFSPAKKTPVKLKQSQDTVSVGAASVPSSINHPADQLPSEPPAVVSGEELPWTDDLGHATMSEPPPDNIDDLDYSVLESEGFSMVSISSIPSAGGYMTSPTPQKSRHDSIDRDLVQSLAGMDILSPSTHGKSTQLHEGPTQEEMWQLERNAVSRQIETTDPNHVITIDSDNEPPTFDEDREFSEEESFMDPGDEYQLCRGRFLQEQERLLQEDCLHSSNLELEKSTNLDDLFSTEDAKPRRGKIPSPWRAGRQVAYNNDVESNDDSGFLPPLPQEMEEVEESDAGPEGIESPVDLSVLLGLRSSPGRDPNRSGPSAGKSLRQRLIEKFYGAEQPESQAEEPLETKRMEVSGGLVLYPSLPNNASGPEDDNASKSGGLPVTGLWAVDSLEMQVGRQRARRCEKRTIQPASKVSGGGGSTPAEDVHVGRMLGVRTYGLSPPDGPAYRDESSAGFSPEQKPLVLKLLSARPGESGAATKDSITEPAPPNHPAQPLPPPKTWTSHHWTLLNTLWLASKTTLRLQRDRNPNNQKTYTAGNLSFECPGRRPLTLDDAEMDVVREFRLVLGKNRVGWGGEFGERKVAKRLYALIVGEEERRARGEVYDDQGRWVGYGPGRGHGRKGGN
ncbi:MAG: hypothetical protein M1839_002918 [Geoglossum umbratile]|nr:MAG: hypothetical protein M1839_002918 [Geoglossum umbratile]